MFGKEFYKNPEILLASFRDMNESYEDASHKSSGKGLLSKLQQFYIRIFGIAEIGFQIRFLYFENVLNRYIKKPPAKILDAGAGIGSQVFWLMHQYPKAAIFGVDVDKNKLTQAKNFIKAKKVHFGYADISKNVQGKNSYDLIVNIDVLEHIKNYKVVLKNFYDLLKKGGYVYIHTPQPNQKRIFKQFEKWHHEDHVREGYSPTLLKKELEKAGFQVVIAKETFGFFGKLAWELNHFALSKSFIFAGITFPFLFLLAKADLLFENKHGLATAILARKI